MFVFDARPGTTMLKLNIPWEEKGWNFYGFAVAEDPNAATPTLRQVAGAFRVEFILAGVEVGLDTYLRRDHNPRYGLDVSTGIGDFDVYADVALRPGDDFEHVFTGPDPSMSFVSTFSGYETQAVGGVTYSRKYNDNDLWTAGVEYFYNHPGYTSPSMYSQVIQQAITSMNSALIPFFYLGQQYGAAYVSLPAPYSWNYTTFTLSTLANLSDRSFITRLDYSVTLLTHLSFEAFAGVHYGHGGGEFRFPFGSFLGSGGSTDYPVVDLGVALRLKI
jgi:hypothetical protein